MWSSCVYQFRISAAIVYSDTSLCNLSGAWSSDHFHDAVHVRLWWSKVAVKSGSMMEMAAHLVVLLSPSCTDPVGPTTTPPNALTASIPNSRSNPSGLPRTTSTSVLEESPSSVDMKTTSTPQHAQDVPPIVSTFTPAFLQDRHRSASTIGRAQPVLISAEHLIPST